MNKITLYIAIVAVIYSLIATKCADGRKKENERLKENQEVLLSDIKHFKYKDSTYAVEVGAMTLQASELKKKNDSITKELKKLGIRFDNLKSTQIV